MIFRKRNNKYRAIAMLVIFTNIFTPNIVVIVTYYDNKYNCILSVMIWKDHSDRRNKYILSRRFIRFNSSRHFCFQNQLQSLI